MEQNRVVPFVSSETEAFSTGGRDIRTVMPGSIQEPETSSITGADDVVGIDLPGVGVVRAGESSPLRPEVESAADEVPLPLHLVGGEAAQSARENREGLLTRLLFAAKDLAESQIEPEDAGEAAFCTECVAEAFGDGSAIAHEENCKTGRVLRVIADLCNLATKPGQAVSKPAPVLALANPAFGEPWRVEQQGNLNVLVDLDGNELAFGVDADKSKLERMAVCVNYCAAVSTRLVEDLTEAVPSPQRRGPVAGDPAEQAVQQ